MNINNFKDFIDSTILKRGYDYYREGNIIESFEIDENDYNFVVEGSEDYEVIVTIDNQGEIIYSECDCPYDFGPICKHEVACYFELLETLNSKCSVDGIIKESIKQPGIKDVLKQLSKDQLIKILLEVTKTDSTLKNSIIFKYSKGNGINELENCKRLIDSIVRKYTGREGYITYRETYGFVNEMGTLLEKIRNTDNVLLALDIACLFLGESVEAFQYADDSNGEIGSLVIESIEIIREIIVENCDSDSNIREKMFHKLLAISDSRVFDGWEDFRIDILRICAEFAHIEELRKKLIMKIEQEVNENSDDEYKKYSNEVMLGILFDLIEEYGNEEEADEFIKANLKYTSFRVLLIDRYTEEKNYSKVIELTLEGEKKDKQYPGLILKWKKIRYTVYKELSMKEKQAKLARELLFDGNFEYYTELKSLVKENESEFYKEIKQEFKSESRRYGRNMYLKLIEHEKDLEAIMEFVKENPRYIEGYAEMLIDQFEADVIETYKKYIKSVASTSSDRKQYQGVCGIINRYKKIAGKDNKEILINELISLYRRRPAFVDELNKINY